MSQSPLAAALGFGPEDWIVIPHQDDIGTCHGSEPRLPRACARRVRQLGSVMVPCPWFPEIAEAAAADPALDLGVQVPGDGKPIVLMADRQPTGGYPKIATVIGADLGRLAQMRPGARLAFAAVGAEAVAARRRERGALAGGIVFEPLVRTHFPSEFLLERNLIDGVTAGE
jgi:hypothetical protein